MKQSLAIPALLLLSICLSVSCTKSTATTSSSTDTLPAVFKKFDSTLVTISVQGDYVVLQSTGIPDHKSPYFASTDSRYEADTDAGFVKNPNSISAQNYTFKIPLHPALNTAHAATPLGPMGIAINGVPLFNQYAGPSTPLTTEIVSFDQYGGHPQQTGQYHYHVEPTYITANHGDSALIGFLLDGFPVYGPVENGVTLSSSDLDTYHGHFGPTPDYPNGIYHYHITADAPYINGSGFYGTAGIVTN
jgi:YHYH protein